MMCSLCSDVLNAKKVKSGSEDDHDEEAKSNAGSIGVALETEDISGKPKPSAEGAVAVSSHQVTAGSEKESVENLERTIFTFPERLMDLLNKGVEKEAMWWMEDGDGFCVLPKHFSDKVLDRYFQGTKFESFTRKLNRWYVHDFFLL